MRRRRSRSARACCATRACAISAAHRRCAGARAGRRAVRRRRQHDRCDRGAGGGEATARLTEREALFARFEAKWRDEPLVLDKWFALQGASRRADTLARVARCSRTRASTRAIPIASARWSAPSRCATSRASTQRDGERVRVRRRPDAGASTAAIRNWRRRSRAHSTCGSGFPSRAGRCNARRSHRIAHAAPPIARRHRNRRAQSRRLTHRTRAPADFQPRQRARQPTFDRLTMSGAGSSTDRDPKDLGSANTRRQPRDKRRAGHLEKTSTSSRRAVSSRGICPSIAPVPRSQRATRKARPGPARATD